MTYLLGISYNYHDAAAALLKDGLIIAASTEERHTRRKHDAAFPRHAIEFCLDYAGISTQEIAHVIYYEQPLIKFERILRTVRPWRGRDEVKSLKDAVRAWVAGGKFEVKTQISYCLDLPENQVHYCSHHLSHAASAFYCSPFQAATVVTIDGVGEWETCSISHAERSTIHQLRSVRFPHSLGLFYSALTAFLGFEVNEGEYKVMGMAAFGRPVYAERMLEWFTLRDDGTFLLRQDLFDLEVGARVPYRPALVDLLGPPRQPDAAFDVGSEKSDGPGTSNHYANIAASTQLVTEQVVEHVARNAINQTGIRALCLAGGVALNSAANQRLRRVLGVPMFVQPAAGDAGCAVGAAKWFYHCVLGGQKREVMRTVALGQDFSDDQVRNEIRQNYSPVKWQEYSDSASLCSAVVDLLVAGKVIGWFQGRAEWGPRALGQRSILANPCVSDMRSRVNRTIKFREEFRPFAPAVLNEEAHRYFELVDAPGEDEEANPYNFMLAIARVRSDQIHQLPAVTHVDGTARVQTVRAASAPLFYQLIAEFGRRTGISVLLNTSFNLRGEPIVNTPSDAIKTFEWSNLDALVIGHILVRKVAESAPAPVTDLAEHGTRTDAD